MSGTGDFNIDVIQRSHTIPVLVDFWAPWCNACKVLSPTLSVLHERHRDEWILVKINVEKHSDLALRYNISAIPSVKLFFGGKIIGEFNGALPGHTIEEWINSILPSTTTKIIKKAKELLYQGNTATAIKLLSDIVMKEPANKEAKALYARGEIIKNPFKAKELVAGIEPVGETGELAKSVITLSQFLTSYTDPASLPQSPAKQPFTEAISYLKAEEFEMTFQKLIESLNAEKEYINGFTRLVCIALFKYLGEENPITRKYRRILGTILYS